MKTLGENVDYEVAGRKLYLEIDFDEIGHPSKKGKSMVIATSRGNITVPGTENVKGQLCKLGLNFYRPNQMAERDVIPSLQQEGA